MIKITIGRQACAIIVLDALCNLYACVAHKPSLLLLLLLVLLRYVAQQQQQQQRSTIIRRKELYPLVKMTEIGY